MTCTAASCSQRHGLPEAPQLQRYMHGQHAHLKASWRCGSGCLQTLVVSARQQGMDDSKCAACQQCRQASMSPVHDEALPDRDCALNARPG